MYGVILENRVTKRLSALSSPRIRVWDFHLTWLAGAEEFVDAYKFKDYVSTFKN